MTQQPEMTPMLGALLRAPGAAIVARIAADLARAGHTDLRPAHFSVFQQLPAEGGRLTVLADRAQMTKQSMGALVEHLVRAGYLERIVDPTDGRAQIIRRTDRGWDVERIARASIQQLEDEWGEALGHERVQQCRQFLADLSGLLNQ
jgi:DNA-binding MarR family transcriptional regulator